MNESCHTDDGEEDELVPFHLDVEGKTKGKHSQKIPI